MSTTIQDAPLPFKSLAARRHHIPKQRHRVTNRAAYDAGLRGRGSLTIWFTEAAIATWRAEPRTTWRAAALLELGDNDRPDAAGRVPLGIASNRGIDRIHHCSASISPYLTTRR
jgi:hypothetical protein